MQMRKNIMDVYTAFRENEKLLRLLYYKPEDANDNPLDTSKENILDKNTSEKWSIIEDRIVRTAKINDLDDDEKCRLLMYLGNRGNTSNYFYASQELIIDVMVHFDFDEVDLRLSWICDTISDIIFNKKVTGVGKVMFGGGRQINAPEGYVGYRLIYVLGGVN